ncbi:unnamed protein product [Prunus armeniaca]
MKLQRKFLVLWFLQKMSQKGKLPELQILNSNNLTEQFHGRVLEFLNHGCSAQFYMILFSPATKFGKREVMTTDNLLKFNPEGCLMILSKSIGFRKWIQNPEAASRSRIQSLRTRASEVAGDRPRRLAVSRVARLGRGRREEALQGGARNHQIWNLLNRKRFCKSEIGCKRKVKSKSIRTMLVNEDDERDKDHSTFDSGKYPFHTVDQYNSDASLNDIHVEEWDE